MFANKVTEYQQHQRGPHVAEFCDLVDRLLPFTMDHLQETFATQVVRKSELLQQACF